MRERLLLIARFKADQELGVQEYGASGRMLDLVLLKESNQLKAVGLDLIEFDGHSQISLDPQVDGELNGAAILGLVRQLTPKRRHTAGPEICSSSCRRADTRSELRSARGRGLDN